MANEQDLESELGETSTAVADDSAAGAGDGVADINSRMSDDFFDSSNNDSTQNASKDVVEEKPPVAGSFDAYLYKDNKFDPSSALSLINKTSEYAYAPKIHAAPDAGTKAPVDVAEKISQIKTEFSTRSSKMFNSLGLPALKTAIEGLDDESPAKAGLIEEYNKRVNAYETWKEDARLDLMEEIHEAKMTAKSGVNNNATAAITNADANVNVVSADIGGKEAFNSLMFGFNTDKGFNKGPGADLIHFLVRKATQWTKSSMLTNVPEKDVYQTIWRDIAQDVDDLRVLSKYATASWYLANRDKYAMEIRKQAELAERGKRQAGTPGLSNRQSPSSRMGMDPTLSALMGRS